jgi:hypothetical protein
MSDLEGVATPVDILRSVFEDAEPGSIRILDARNLIPSIVLQAVADGRVSVYFNSAIVVGNIKPLAERFLTYFDRFHTPVTCTAGRETFILDGPMQIPTGCQALRLSVAGFLQCTALFAVVAQLPRDVTCPLVLVGFPLPRDSQRLRREFEDFVAGRDFPSLDLKAVARQRVRLEGRNREYLLHTSKARQNLVQRYTRADQALQRRAEQIETLTREVDALVRARSMPPPSARISGVERTIDRIDRAINEVTAYATKLAATAEGRAEGRQMSHKEELALLETLKNQVRETRQQLDALNEQKSP